MPASATQEPETQRPTRTFAPYDLNAGDAAQVVPLYESLLNRPVASAAELGRWLLDVSELFSVVDEYVARRYIDKSCHTEDKAIEARFLDFIENVDPKLKPLFFALQKKYLQSPHRAEYETTDPKLLAMLARGWQADVDVYRDENVPLETEATKVINEYDKICGAMMVSFDGREYTTQQMARFQEQTDRDVRRRAWEATVNRRLQDRAALDQIFEQLLDLRARIAANAGFDNYRSYVWRAYRRYDYTPEQCLTFADAIAQACVPLARELDRQRRHDLKVDALRPWDTAVDPLGRPPLEPFRQDDVAGFVEKTRHVFQRMSPPLADDFDSLRRNANLDLDSRKGKQPGGYQANLMESRQPFIFMNAAGLHHDVETLLHEAGHAFHCLAVRDEPLVFLRNSPMEFAEVASMSMELLGADHFDAYYPSPADAARAKRTLIEGIVRTLPWVATIDSFQHWLYTHPGHTAAERTSHWLSLLDRFGGDVDWTGYEPARQAMWHRQLHLFQVPFYYVEYGIAQLGALQLWMKSREDPRRALANYRAALALGGTRPLPELFAAAGIRFDFSLKTIVPLMNALREELAELPR